MFFIVPMTLRQTQWQTETIATLLAICQQWHHPQSAVQSLCREEEWRGHEGGILSEFCATVGTVPASCKYWVHAFPSLNRDVRWFRSDYIEIRMKRSHSSPGQCPMIGRPWHRWQKKQQRAAKMRQTWCRCSAMCPWIPYTHKDDITSPIWFLC